MSEYNFKYTLLKRRSSFLDFLKMDGELIERLRSWWALIEDFLRALNELLNEVEMLAWETLSWMHLNALLNALDFLFSNHLNASWIFGSLPFFCFPPFKTFIALRDKGKQTRQKKSR